MNRNLFSENTPSLSGEAQAITERLISPPSIQTLGSMPVQSDLGTQIALGNPAQTVVGRPFPLQPTLNEQIKFERELFAPMRITQPEFIPINIQGVLVNRADPPRYFAPGVGNPDLLTPKPLSQSEQRKFERLRSEIAKDYAIVDRTSAEIKRGEISPKVLKDKAEAEQRIARDKEMVFSMLPRVRMAHQAGLNGAVDLVVADPKNMNKTPIIYVNGINTDYARSTTQSWELSKVLGAPIRHIININDPAVAGAIGTKLARENWKNLEGAQQVNVKELLANPRAANALANVVYDDIQKGLGPPGSKEPIIVAVYSQGGPIAARGLEYVIAQLDRDVKSGKISADVREQQLDRIHVVGFASAAAHRDFPKELRDRIHFVYDRNDAIPKGRNYTGSTNYFDVGQALGGRDPANQDKFNLTHASYFWGQEFVKPAPYNPNGTKQLQDWASEIRQGRNPSDKLVELDITNPKFRKSDRPYLP
jgi:hypothetical protein